MKNYSSFIQDHEKAIDQLQRENFQDRIKDSPCSTDYLEYVGRKIQMDGNCFTGRNHEHAILECLFDAISKGRTFSTWEVHQQPKAKNIKVIRVYRDEVAIFDLIFNAEDQHSYDGKMKVTSMGT